jgi:multiple sugar transport system substrate-binding protein
MAWDYLQFAFGKTLARPFTYQTGVGTRLSVHTDPELVAKWPHLTANLAQMHAAVPRPKAPWWEQALFALGTELSSALVQEKTVEQAMNDANAEVEKIVSDNDYHTQTYVTKEEMIQNACNLYKKLNLTHPDCK